MNNKIKNFKTRVKKANSSFGVMGEFMLTMQIDQMELAEMIELRDCMLLGKNPVSYEYLDKKIATKSEKVGA